ncbi:MAG: hypothetical protein ACYDD4_08810 [Acidimicrobiales bacterium]
MLALAGGVALSACSGTPAHPKVSVPARRAAGSGVASSTVPTTPAVKFPAVVVQAMAEFGTLPAGAEAPGSVPSVTGTGFVTAQTSGLAGVDNVTLIDAPTPTTVDSPALSATGAGRELGSYSTTATSSPAAAGAAIAQARGEAVLDCAGSTTSVVVPGLSSAATGCPTIEGEAIDVTVGTWTIQVLTLNGSSPSTAEASALAEKLTASGFPGPSVAGLVSVVVPANASAGNADTANIEWIEGADLYQVRSSDDPSAALDIALAMRPYPAT